MSIRFTKEEALDLGLKQDTKGNWYDPKGRLTHGRIQAPPKVRDPGSVPERKHESGWERIKAERADKKEVAPQVPSQVRYRISVTAYRRRRADIDNLFVKYFIDELVRQRIIPDDNCDIVESITKQIVRIKAPEQEKTVIEVWIKL